MINPTIMRLQALKTKLEATQAAPSGLNAIRGTYREQAFTIHIAADDANVGAIVLGTLLDTMNLMREHADDFVLGIEDTIRMVYLLTEDEDIASIQLPSAIIAAVQAEYPDADVRASIDACMEASLEPSASEPA